jgi:hypothetical protein
MYVWLWFPIRNSNNIKGSNVLLYALFIKVYVWYNKWLLLYMDSTMPT